MGRLSDVKVGDLTRAVLRFRPLLGLVGVALLLLVVLPNRHASRPSDAALGHTGAAVSFPPQPADSGPDAGPPPPAVAAPPALISESSPAFGVPTATATISDFSADIGSGSAS